MWQWPNAPTVDPCTLLLLLHCCDRTCEEGGRDRRGRPSKNEGKEAAPSHGDGDDDGDGHANTGEGEGSGGGEGSFEAASSAHKPTPKRRTDGGDDGERCLLDILHSCCCCWRRRRREGAHAYSTILLLSSLSPPLSPHLT